MSDSSRQWIAWCVTALIVAIGPDAAGAGISVALVESDDPPSAAGARTQLLATGFFSDVTIIDTRTTTPTLSQLTSFAAVLAYTSLPTANPTALGNVLADYADLGGGLVLATYAYDPTPGFAITGRIATAGYSPLTLVTTSDVSGRLVATRPGDPIFSGVNLSTLTYFHNNSFGHPGLDAGATLLATDGDGFGINMIARSSVHPILGYNLFPGSINFGDSVNNDQFYRLLANGLVNVGTAAVPEPATLTLFGIGMLGVLGYAWLGRRSPSRRGRDGHHQRRLLGIWLPEIVKRIPAYPAFRGVRDIHRGRLRPAGSGATRGDTASH